MDNKTKTVEGLNLSGEKRKYTFNLMNAEQGTRIFHEYLPLVVELMPIKDSAVDVESLSEINPIEIVQKIPVVLAWEKLKELAREMLSGLKVVIDGTDYTAGDDGFGEYAEGQPVEVYTALFYAVKANYPKYIDPLFATLDDHGGTEGDTSQG